MTAGEVPNLFAPDEKANILERVQLRAQEENKDIGETSFTNLYNVFLNNVKSNLHIVLAMSPLGPSFRNRQKYVFWPFPGVGDFKKLCRK